MLEGAPIMSASIMETRNENSSLSESVTRAVEKYLNEVEGYVPVDLYKLVIEEVEVPLFKAVIEYTRYNQSKAAIMLGISRGTLRAKLRKYFDDKYVGSREDGQDEDQE